MDSFVDGRDFKTWEINKEIDNITMRYNYDNSNRTTYDS